MRNAVYYENIPQIDSYPNSNPMRNWLYAIATLATNSHISFAFFQVTSLVFAPMGTFAMVLTILDF